MSSHHIVREDQEPALFIQDPGALSFEKTQELLEWSPTVIVPYRHADAVVAWGIKVDIVLVPTADEQAARTLLADQMPIKLLSVNTVDEEIATVLFFLKGARYSGVHVVSHDTSLFAFQAWPPHFDLEIFQGNRRWVHVSVGKFTKWYPAGARLEIRSGTGVLERTLTHEGIFEWENLNTCWIGEFYGP